VDYGIEGFDIALSTYSLHHFSRELKLSLYKNIRDTLKKDGVYIEGDYTVNTIEEENHLIEENESIRRENGITDGFYHIDIPFSIQTQSDLLKEAGFSNVEIKKQWDNTTIFLCHKS